MALVVLEESSVTLLNNIPAHLRMRTKFKNEDTKYNKTHALLFAIDKREHFFQ